ncbi:hemagglutinin, partial [Salmonella enterica]
MGDSNSSHGDNNVAIGTSNSITGEDASRLGYGNTVIGTDNEIRGSNGVVIGNSSQAFGDDGVAIGNNATSYNGGVAIGAGSFATRADEMNIGNREITGVKDGASPDSAATVRQVEAAKSEAFTYTDSQVMNATKDMRSYTDNSSAQTLIDA